MQLLSIWGKSQYFGSVSPINKRKLLLFLVHQEVKIPGVKSKINNKLECLRVGIVLNWESLVKEDSIKPLNQDADPLE